MKKLFAILIFGAACLGARAQYQLGNSDFEEWEAVTYNTYSGDEPKEWSSFLNASGSKKKLGVTAVQLFKSTEVRQGGFGTYCAKITANSVIGVVAQGNLTNGCINMGSMKAADAAGNYNYINEGTDGQAMTFTGKPDAMTIWVNFHAGKGGTANVSTILCTKGYYQDPLANERNGKTWGTLIATAQNNQIKGDDTWVQYTIPFKYVNNDLIPYYALVSISTAASAGDDNKNKNDVLYVDDIEMVYNSELTGAKYNGEDVAFENRYANISAIYEPEKLPDTDLTSNGQGASIDRVYDEETALLTITVSGNNIKEDPKNKHVYTIQFKKPSDVVSEKSYTETLYVTINGETTEPQDANVLVQTRYDGNFNFVLKNFVLDGSIPVGNINVPSLTKKVDGSFSFQGTTIIEAGDLEGVAEDGWLGPELGVVPLDLKGQFVGEDHLRVSIDIDMTSTLEQFIYVHLGYDAASLAVNSAAKYGTFCAPFDVTIPAGVTAYIIGGIAENGKLTLVEQKNTIPAHTPVIVYSESTTDINAVQFGVATSSTATSKYLTGVYTDTKAPLGSYVLQNQNGRVGFYHVEGTQPWVRANRAYLTVPASANVKAFYMDDATAIQTVEELLSGKAEIYDLAGRRQQKLQKGINIVGGKKVLVK